MPVTVADHHTPGKKSAAWVVAALVFVSAAPLWASKPNPEADPQASKKEQVKPSTERPPAPLVQKLLDDQFTSADEKQRLRLFHGQWAKLGDLTPRRRAHLRLMQYKLDAPVFTDKDVPPVLRAKAMLQRGAPEQALNALDQTSSIEARWLKAQAHQDLGRRGQAVAQLKPVRQQLLAHQVETANAMTAGAQALALLARLQGRPAADYHLVMRLLARAHQELDPLYWPAHLAEARLLLAKHNPKQALEALKQAIKLNPKASEAWFLLGKLGAEQFNFERAEMAIKQLRAINNNHPLASRLAARLALVQRKPQRARTALQPVLQRWPHQRAAVALQAAIEGLAYKPKAMRAVFSRFEELAPGSAQAHTVAGAFLSQARQYELAEQVLRDAVRRAPNWPKPRNELGLLLMQMGQLKAAADTLRRATELDPFQKQAANQLKLARTLLDYETVETEHFIIRYKPGIDAVLARDMPRQLERLYDQITSVFSHEPKRKTQIDLMPSEQHFAVRITGMPDIWTIAAATGPVIALTPPRAGADQRGVFDWANVIGHEFVHTVTLDRTANRLPHWFTEGCAVSQELTGRSYQDCKLLQWAMQRDKLFPLDELNWGFIRPKTQRERPLAYAQAHWLIDYLTEQYGHESVLRLMRLYNDGLGNVQAMEKVTGQAVDVFFQRFQRWGLHQMRQWGMARPIERQTVLRLFAEQRPATDAQEMLALWSSTEPDPAALKKQAQQQLQSLNATPLTDDAADEAIDATTAQASQPAYREAQAAVSRYARARPVDPWADRAMAQIALRLGQRDKAIGALQRLDRVETGHGTWAFYLARLYRQVGQMDEALASARRALDREPYNPRYRELAATLALQAKKPKRALHHLQAMPRLEPKVAKHHVRLAALHHRMKQFDQANHHAKQARQLDADAPVQRFQTKPKSNAADH
jgi:tetratricopeptide (TPR) repeat protein